MDNKKVGKFICELRKEKGWTQDELAEKLFVDRTMVSKWERGVYIPTTEILLKMQELFDVSINEIIFGERKNNNNLSSVDAVPIQIMEEEKKKRKKILIIGIVVPFTWLVNIIGLVPIPLMYMSVIIGVPILYCFVALLAKKIYIKKYGEWI